MRSFVHILFFLLTGIGAKAQQNYFVYVQTENKQPFTVKLNDRTMTSSGTGYVVIPKLTNGSYILNVSFPANVFPMQTLALTVANDDAGYLMKNFGEKGWGLYNIRTMEVTMSNGTKEKADGDVFIAALSGAANTTLTTAPVKDPMVKEVKNDELPVLKERPSYTTISIQKTGGTNTEDGLSAVYIDKTAAGNDTISMFIPAPEKVAVAEKEEPVIKAAEVKSAPAKDKKFLDIELENPAGRPADTLPSAAVTPVIVSEKQTVTTPFAKDKSLLAFNSDCKMNARDNEYLKLRKKMAGENADEAMIKDAEKMFKQMCWSAEQVKNLCMLLSSDSARYMFFDMAYPHIYDTQNFPSLQLQLTDAYYINRFRALIRN